MLAGESANKGKEKARQKKMRKRVIETKKRDVAMRNWKHLCLTPLHSVSMNHALKPARRTVQVSLGFSIQHNIPLATFTHTHQSIRPCPAHLD